MPELPETETIASDLQQSIRGARIARAVVSRADVLRVAGPAELTRRVTGAMIMRCWRRAKSVVVDLSNEDRIVVQPRFTGALLIDQGDLPDEQRRYSAIRFDLDDGRSVHYRDVRRLGTVALMDPGRFARFDASLGVEPLDRDFTSERLSALLRTSRQAVKKVLMDQRAVAGVGNIYANEALWRAGIDPSRQARSLASGEVEALQGELVAVLREAVAARGTSFRDYRDAAGARGGYAERLSVYGRGGEPCPSCGTRLTATHAIDGRTTVFCHCCQR